MLARRRARELRPSRAMIAEFAATHGLALKRMRPLNRAVELTGTVAQIQKAFGAELYRDASGHFSRTGPLHLPVALAPWVRAVLGFGGGRAKSQSGAGDRSDRPGLLPSEVAGLYGMPRDMRADGQCVGIIAQGGAYQASDLELAAAASGTPAPAVVTSGQLSEFGAESDADTELALDLQVLSGVAPGVKLAVYAAPNNIENMVDALHAAISDRANAPSVISISWGSSEEEWPADVRDVFDSALCDAFQLRMAVVVAAGDYLATGGMLDGKAHVFYPASSPYVLSCGGTALTLDPRVQAILDEQVWNDPIQAIGSGGGISNQYPVPQYQSAIALPPSANAGDGLGRGVPDVAAAAGADPGYSICVAGGWLSEPGTSAATPLWAGLLATANARRGSPLGFANSVLYANADAFRGITNGNNRVRGIGYDAGAGWNACTGLGVPNCPALTAALTAVA